ncbi:MAG: hypothetical protein HXY23_14085 [Parvularculaceae bacterium]|nr:hypothetical protein [Parvularculaceae bacterium]
MKDEPTAPKATATTIRPRADMTPGQKAAFRQLAGDIAKLGVLQVVDRTALELAAIHLDRVRRGESVVDSTRIVAHFLANCGLTPAARVRLGTLPTKRESGGDVPEELRDAAHEAGA